MGARVLAASGQLMFTPRVEGGLAVSRSLRVGAVARYGYASADDLLGTVSVQVVTGGLAASWTVFDFLATGPRLELGAFAAHGDGKNGTSVGALAASGAWEIELRAHLGGSLALVFALEGGWYAGGLDLRADERSVLEASGPFVGVSAGVALVPSATRR